MVDDNPYSIWREIDKALMEYIGDTWDGDDIADRFLCRLATLCAMSLITPRQRDFVTLWRQRFTPGQIEQLTGEQEPPQARDRRLTQAEISRISNWSCAVVRRDLAQARDAIASQLDEN